jgi:hypothetical protein
MMAAPSTWLMLWSMGAVGGLLTGSDKLALICLLVAIPAFILTQLANLPRYDADPPEGEASPSVLTHLPLGKRFANDNDRTGQTLH